MAEAPKPVVFVVDDDVSVRESLELVIRSAGWEPRLFASASDFLASPRSLLAGCLILDVSLPDLNGLELQEQIGAERLHLPIIFITGHGDIPMTVRAMKAGAIEFLTKPYRREVLLGAIRQAIARSRTALVEDAELHVLYQRHASLTQREQQVMELVVSGMLNKQVGGQLGISELTVKTHRGRVMRKMKARSLAELVRIATRLHATPGQDH